MHDPMNAENFDALLKMLELFVGSIAAFSMRETGSAFSRRIVAFMESVLSLAAEQRPAKVPIIISHPIL